MSIIEYLSRAARDRDVKIEMLRFLMVGGGATMLDLGVFRVLQCSFGVNPPVCFAAAFSISVVCRFLADKFFTFRDITANYGRQFTLYIGACVITLLIGLCVFEVLNYLTDLPFLSKIVSVPFVTVAGYVLFRIIVFRN